MQRTSSLRRWGLLGGTAAVAVAIGASQVAAGHRAAPLPAGLPAATVENVSSQTPTVSADGHLVVYSGAPAIAGDGRTSTIWLKDRTASTVTELTAPTPDIRTGNSLWPVLSADGCSVTVVTELAYDLFRDDDTGDRWDVYRLLLPACGGQTGDWELVSTASDNGLDVSADDDVSPLYPPAVSGDGNVIAFTRRFSAAAPELTGVMVVDLSVPQGLAGRSSWVAGTPTEVPDSTFRYRGLREPSVSYDGLIVAYTSDAESSLLTPVWGVGAEAGAFATSNVFVWARAETDPNTAVRSVSATPGIATGDGFSPDVSGDGNLIAFVSSSTNLVPGAMLPACTPRCVAQVYLYDRINGTTSLASRAPVAAAGQPPVGVDADALHPALNHHGDELLYVTRATNLFDTHNAVLGAADDGDIVLYVPSTGKVDRVSVLADGVSPAPAANSHPHMSATGNVVVFDTLAGSAFGNPAAIGRQVGIVDHPPILSLADLDVGTVAVGFPGPEWFLVLSNEGPSSFVPATAVTSNPDFLVSGGSCIENPGTAVPPGGSCTVNIELMPSIAGDLTSTLTVAEAGEGGTAITSNLIGRGGDPQLAPSPAGAYGGSLVVGTRGEPLPFILRNVAFNPVSITTLEVSGTNKDDFQVIVDECSDTTIEADITCNVQVIFAPTGAGRRTATIVAQTADGVYATILVSGDAHYEPKIAVGSTIVVGNSRLSVVGSGFAPNSVVTIAWADGAGRSTTVTTDATGALNTTIIVRATDRPGDRALVAKTSDGQSAAADVQIIAPQKRLGPGSAAWPTPKP